MTSSMTSTDAEESIMSPKIVHRTSSVVVYLHDKNSTKLR